MIVTDHRELDHEPNHIATLIEGQIGHIPWLENLDIDLARIDIEGWLQKNIAKRATVPHVDIAQPVPV